MAKSLATLRAEESADCAYLIAIEGLPYMWVTDHTGDGLLGSGAGTWIGTYEAANTTWEDVGTRTVLPGLRIRRPPTRADLDAKSGLFKTTSWEFEIIDHDGVLGALFATEGKDKDPLGARVAAGTSAIGGTITLRGGATPTAAAKNIGIERLGPAGERRWWWCLPEQGIGLHHQVHADKQENEGPAVIPVSDDPLVFAGRKVTLWRLYHDVQAGDGYDAWPTWDNYYPTYAPEWVGVLRDAGEFDGADTWTIKCHGWESLLRRTLGTVDHGWSQIVEAPVTLDTHELGVGLSFESRVTSSGTITTYDSIDFGTSTLTAAATRDTIIADLTTIISNVGTGSTSDFGAGGAFFSENFGSAGHECTAGISTGQFTIKRGDQSFGGATNAVATMRLCLHEKVWRLLGFEPAFQSATTPETDTQAFFELRSAGDGWASGASVEVPSDNYWNAYFTTRAVGQNYASTAEDGADNGGNTRAYKAIYQNEPLILGGSSNDQTIEITSDFPYIEIDNTIELSTYDAARYFVFRGKRFAGQITEQGNVLNEDGVLVDAEAEDFGQVAEVHWDYNGTSYGTVLEGNSGPKLYIHRWLDPRKFGLPYDKLDGEWSALAGTDYAIEIAPLNCWAYAETPDHPNLFERASSVFTQLLVSTGTATGYSAGVYTYGSNDTGGSGNTVWHNDAVSSELGLGIPAGLVQAPATIYAEFDSVEGGIDGGLNQVRASYQGPVNSWDVIRDMVQPRGLALSLAGGQFGVVKLGVFDPADAQFSITENDLYGAMDDPRDVHPVQSIRATGAIDVAAVSVDLNPITGESREVRKIRARDAGAKYRRGDLEEDIPGHSLRKSAWEDDLRNTWAFDRADFFSKRHFVVDLPISRIQGQDLYPGAKVTLTNRNIITSTGTRGVTNALALVLRSQLKSADSHSYQVRFLVFDEQFDNLRLFAPIGKIVSDGIQGTTVTLETDWFGHGEGADAARFAEPAWSSVGGRAIVCILEWDRGTWTLHSGDTASVSGVAGDVVGLVGAFSSTYHKYTDKWLVMVPYDSQNASEWVQSRMLPIVKESRKFGASDTSGFKYVNA